MTFGSVLNGFKSGSKLESRAQNVIQTGGYLSKDAGYFYYSTSVFNLYGFQCDSQQLDKSMITFIAKNVKKSIINVASFVGVDYNIWYLTLNNELYCIDSTQTSSVRKNVDLTLGTDQYKIKLKNIVSFSPQSYVGTKLFYITETGNLYFDSRSPTQLKIGILCKIQGSGRHRI